MKVLWKKIGMIFLAMNLVGLAVALFLANRLGSDSIGLLCDGIRAATGLQYGNASLAYNLLVIVLAWLTARKNLGLGTIVYALCSGYFIDFYSWLLAPLSLGDQALVFRVLGFIAGQTALSLALAILIQMNLGMNALDALLYCLEKISHIPYAYLRTGIDISYVIVGTALGGTFGAGTICSVLLTGTMVSVIIKLLQKTGQHKQEEKRRPYGIAKGVEKI